jgi:hypothetical protein
VGLRNGKTKGFIKKARVKPFGFIESLTLRALPQATKSLGRMGGFKEWAEEEGVGKGGV